MLYIYLILLSFALPIFSMSDDVKHKRKILKKINAAKNKENSKNVPNIGIPSPVDYKKIIIFSPGTTPEIQPVPCGDGKKTNTKALVDQSNTTNQHNAINNLQAQPNQSVTDQKAIATEESAPSLAIPIKINPKDFIDSVKKNEYKTIKDARPEHLRNTYDANGDNLMQILLRTGTKPNLYLVKRLIPLTHWGHLNNSNESVLDLLDVSSKRHSEIAPYIINTIYAYVMNRPDVSRNEDITKQSGHSISPRKDDKVKKSLSAGAVLEEPAKEKITSTELLLKKYNIVQAYIKDKVKGRR